MILNKLIDKTKTEINFIVYFLIFFSFKFISINNSSETKKTIINDTTLNKINLNK